jgi:predicted DNA-binding protein (MmcQ/YjbR family)
MDLRERYRSVTPGYHMNKVHWNTVVDDGSIPKKEVLAMIDHSYDLVYKSLSRAEREKIERGDA